ncbi:MAG: hypothetical protein AAF518_04085 [Spirochaetota bacterium]
MNKIIVWIVLGIGLSSCASSSSFEKEKLAFEKERLAFEKEKLAFEKLKFLCQKKSFTCNGKYSSCLQIKPACAKKSVVFLPKENLVPSKTDCVSIPTPSSPDIWQLAERGGWSYSYFALKKGSACKGDTKETFYKSYGNSESYVAKTQVPRTKKSSCINNVLFSAKGKLYKLMLEKTGKELLSSSQRSRVNQEKVLRQVVQYNNEGKKRSFYYECKPSDAARQWNSCRCVLFASHENGKTGLANRMKKER